jgi:hypothetical protein
MQRAKGQIDVQATGDGELIPALELNKIGTAQQKLLQLKSILPWILLMVILLLGATLRIYRLPEVFGFAPDQGRDATIVWRMIETGEPVQLGPTASIGTYKRGPAYYYLLLIPYLIGRGNPLSGVALNVLFDLATILMLFIIGRVIHGFWAGLTAAGLWCVADLALYFTSFAWNPTLLPCLVLLMLYALYGIINNRPYFLLLLLPLWSIAWQLHDQAIFLLPIFGLVWVWFRPRISWKIYALAITLGLLSIAPFLVYELQHGFANMKAMLTFSKQSSGQGVGVAWGNQASIRIGKSLNILDQRLLPIGQFVHPMAQLLLLIGLAGAIFSAFRGQQRKAAQLLLIICLLPFCYAFWPGNFDPHYLTILFPLPFLLLGVGIGTVRRIHWLPGVVLGIGISWFVLSHGQTTLARLQQRGQGSYQNILNIVDAVIDNAQGKPFAVRITSRWDGSEASESPYLYLLALRGHPPLSRADIDTYTIYDPQTLGDGPNRQGIVVADAKITKQEGPKLGQEILQDGHFMTTQNGASSPWQFTGPKAQTITTRNGNALLLTGQEIGDGLNATQDVIVEPGKRYLIRFDYRNTISEGALYCHFQVYDSKHASVKIFSYATGISEDWAVGSFIVETPPDAHTATLWLRNRGVGEAGFRNIEVREIIP